VGTFTGRIALTGVICSSAICAGVAGTANAAVAAPAAPAAVRAVKGHITSYDYGSGTRQNLTAYWYTGTATARPVIVMVHGGYWIEGSKSSWDSQARWWAGHGFAVVAMNYHYATQARWSAQRTDVSKALTWVRAHARGLNANTKKIILMGASAGGQMAVSAGAYGCGGCRVRGVVALSPVANPWSSWSIGHNASGSRKKLANAAVTLAGCTPRKSNKACWNRWVDMAARYHASSDDAPMLIYHSQHDLVPASQSKGLASAMHAKGVGVTVRVVSGKKHGGGILGVSGVRSQIYTWIRTRV
jgi:acetyl esterase/lipase